MRCVFQFECGLNVLELCIKFNHLYKFQYQDSFGPVMVKDLGHSRLVLFSFKRISNYEFEYTLCVNTHCFYANVPKHY